MFGKKKQPPIKSLIAEGSCIEGNLKFTEGLRVDGDVIGNIYAIEGSASILVISVEDMSKALDTTGRGLRKNPDSPKLQARMARIVQIVQTTRELFQGSLEYTRIWLKSPHPALDLQSPLALIQNDHIEAVEDLLELIQRGQPA